MLNCKILAIISHLENKYLESPEIIFLKNNVKSLLKIKVLKYFISGSESLKNLKFASYQKFVKSKAIYHYDITRDSSEIFRLF